MCVEVCEAPIWGADFSPQREKVVEISRQGSGKAPLRFGLREWGGWLPKAIHH